jgi:Ca-activated chloride channel family protein
MRASFPHRTLALMAVLALVLALVGCGGDGGSGPVTGQVEGPTEAPVVVSATSVSPETGGTTVAVAPVTSVVPSATEVPDVLEPVEEALSSLRSILPTPTVDAEPSLESRPLAPAPLVMAMPSVAQTNMDGGISRSDGQKMVGSVGFMSGSGAPGSPGLPPEAGGEHNPNDGLLPLVYFEGHGVNPFVDADEDALSTFALDGDTASYEIAQLYLGEGSLPPPDSVRLEEWVNAFPGGYEGVDDGLALRLDGMMSPFGEDDYRLLRVGVVSERPDADRDPVSLIFVVDISGSMASDDRLGVAKQVIRGLVERLRVDDRVGLVTYGDRGRVDHSMTDVAGSEGFLGRVLEMVPEGATNVEEGIVTAYRLAADELELEVGRSVRIVVFSDGVGNLGSTGPSSVLELVDQAGQRGAALTTVGVGVGGNYNDVMLEALANRGNGTYHYVRGRDHVERFLREHADSVFVDVARDARIQMEFRPDVVRKYRLLGYENRSVADSSFRDDTLDFGELGFARDVTALYEVRLEDGAAADAELAVARLRWRDSRSGVVEEVEAVVTVGQVSGPVSEAMYELVLVSAVAELAELMRRSYWAQCGSPADVLELLADVEGVDAPTEEFVALAKVAEASFEPYCDR